jgi:branched-subunit amino acid aminotransferase/4-amino-4-deoxychorismate lyase
MRSNRACHWISGRLYEADDSALPRALLDRAGCYTTARVLGGTALFAGHHARRLARDARALGIGAPDEAAVLRAFHELGRAAFVDGSGIVSLKACRGDAGGPALVGTSRPIGDEPEQWQAALAPLIHPGARATGGRILGTKRTHQTIFASGRTHARGLGVEEVLLFDDRGRLVEGARTNLIVVSQAGRILTPAPSLGPVAGVALEVLRERRDDIAAAEIDLADVRSARELICMNAVRLAVPIRSLDGVAIGGPAPGPVATQLRAALAAG